MKTQKTLLTIFVSTQMLFVAAQTPGLEWQASLGGSSYEYATDIIETNDGGSLVVGQTASNDGDVGQLHGGTDIWVVKLDANGMLEWENTYGGTANEQAAAVLELPGAFLIAGETQSNDGDVSGNHGEKDAWVIAIDSIGVLAFQKTFGGTQWDAFIDITATVDGGYAAVGFSESNNGDLTLNNGLYDVWVVKLDPNLEVEWQRSLGGQNDDIGEAILENAEGDLVFAARTKSNDGDVSGNHANNTYDFWTVKLDDMGNTLWQTANGGSLSEEPNSILALDDGGYVVAGSAGSNDGDVSFNPGNPVSIMWVIKLDQDGTLQWEKSYGGASADEAYDMQVAANGELLVVGGTSSSDGDVSFNHGSRDLWALRIDVAGGLIWETALGGSQWDEGYAMIIGSDQQMLVAGTSSSNDGNVTGNHGDSDAWVAKLGPDVVGLLEESASLFSIYPNPSHGALNVAFSGPYNARELVLSDAFGRIIWSQQPQAQNLALDLEALPAGVYLLTLNAVGAVWTERIILE